MEKARGHYAEIDEVHGRRYEKDQPMPHYMAHIQGVFPKKKKKKNPKGDTE